MVQKYYTVTEAADILNVAPADVKQMQERRELYGYRDGADWKFKIEDVEQLAIQRARPPEPAESADEQDEVLLSEVVLGEPSAGASGTVIGMPSPHQSAGDSDLQLAGSDIQLIEGGAPSAVAGRAEPDTQVTHFENLELEVDEGLSLGGSSVTSGAKPAEGGSVTVVGPQEEPATGESSVDLTGEAADDDMVLGGGSGSGSDITIGGDSGISLVDAADSGLSLEQPLSLAPAAEESLGLEDESPSTADARAAASTAVKTDDDFLLTPLEETGDADDSESGSQVIALDTESDDSATIIAHTAPGSMATMLEEDLGSSAEPALGLSASAPLGDLGMAGAALAPETVGMTAMAPIVEGAGFALPEAPYKTMDIVLLSLCAFVLMFCGMFMFDLMRNMHYWDTAYSVNSTIMDMILGK